MTTTYRTMTGDEARAAAADLRSIDPNERLRLDADLDAYGQANRGVFRLADGVPVELIGVDGGESEDQTLARDWSWVVGALTAAYTYGAAEGAGHVPADPADTPTGWGYLDCIARAIHLAPAGAGPRDVASHVMDELARQGYTIGSGGEEGAPA